MNEEKITQNIYVQIPTVQYFIKTYDNSFSGILKSAAENFKRYESSEKYRRLQNELQAVAKDQVNENLCNQVMQIKRKQKTYYRLGFSRFFVLDDCFHRGHKYFHNYRMT